jgi:hypothetical protein
MGPAVIFGVVFLLEAFLVIILWAAVTGMTHFVRFIRHNLNI